jgi:hypothetical protein
MNSEEKSNKMLFTRRYDLAGNPILRTSRHQVLSRCIPLGNYRGGAGFKCLLAFVVLHYFGKPIFSILVRCERQAAFLYKMRNRFKKVP